MLQKGLERIAESKMEWMFFVLCKVKKGKVTSIQLSSDRGNEVFSTSTFNMKHIRSGYSGQLST